MLLQCTQVYFNRNNHGSVFRRWPKATLEGSSLAAEETLSCANRHEQMSTESTEGRGQTWFPFIREANATQLSMGGVKNQAHQTVQARAKNKKNKKTKNPKTTPPHKKQKQ